MNIQNARLLLIAQYAAPYEGNFIASLKTLEVILKEKFDCEVAYVFLKLFIRCLGCNNLCLSIGLFYV